MEIKHTQTSRTRLLIDTFINYCPKLKWEYQQQAELKKIAMVGDLHKFGHDHFIFYRAKFFYRERVYVIANKRRTRFSFSSGWEDLNLFVFLPEYWDVGIEICKQYEFFF